MSSSENYSRYDDAEIDILPQSTEAELKHKGSVTIEWGGIPCAAV